MLDRLRQRRVLCVAVALLQNGLTAGIFYGWAALSALFVDLGVYAGTCAEVGCVQQRQQLHYVYTIAQSLNLFGSLFGGIVLDRFGPRKCSVLSLLGVATGFLLMALSARGNLRDGGYIFPAMALIGFWGPGVQVALFHLSNLFPTKSNTVMSMISGTFNLGFFVFLAFRWINESLHISLYSISSFYCGLLVLFTLVSVVLWPDETVENLQRKEEGHTIAHASMYTVLHDAMQPMLSVHFGVLLLWMTINIFFANYYIGTVTDQLATYFGPDHVYTLSYVFTIVLPLGTLTMPFYGWFMDLYGFGWAMLIGCCFALVYSVMTNIRTFAGQVTAFIFYSLFRTALFTSVFVYVGSEFGFKSFGILTGVLFLVSSLVGLAQYSFVRTLHADYTVANYIELGCILLTFTLPLYIFSRSRRLAHTHYESIPSEHDMESPLVI